MAVKIARPVRPPAACIEEAEARFWELLEARLGGRQWTRLIELLGRDVPEPETIAGWRALYKRIDAALAGGARRVAENV